MTFQTPLLLILAGAFAVTALAVFGATVLVLGTAAFALGRRSAAIVHRARSAPGLRRSRSMTSST